MDNWLLILAYALIVGNVDGAKYNHPVIRDAVQGVAVQMELLDQRELRFICARQEDFHSDLQLLHNRYEDLKDAPPASDAERFPPRDAITFLLTFNRSYRTYLEGEQVFNPRLYWTYQQFIQETDELYYIWDFARDARCEYYYVTVRRTALKNLRDKLGKESYYAGQMPPNVPVWNFISIDR